VLTISSEGYWPLVFVAEVKKENDTPYDRYDYHPRSDFLFSLETCPRINIEVHSKKNKSDLYRMLLQAGLLVRVVNKIKPELESFVAIAIYITEQFTAERYLLYQPDLDNEAVGIPNSLIADHSS
jgi:hypothetical protein